MFPLTEVLLVVEGEMVLTVSELLEKRGDDSTGIGNFGGGGGIAVL